MEESTEGVLTTRSYARHCCSLAVAQVCLELGFERSEEAALDLLADTVRSFVDSKLLIQLFVQLLLGVAKRTFANMVHSQRGTVALNDCLSAFQQAPSCRIAWRDLDKFAFRENGWNLPSATVVPVLPAKKRARLWRLRSESFVDAKRRRRHSIPSFLPPFPPSTIYAPDDKKVETAALQKALQNIADRITQNEAKEIVANEPIDLTTKGETDDNNNTAHAAAPASSSSELDPGNNIKSQQPTMEVVMEETSNHS